MGPQSCGPLVFHVLPVFKSLQSSLQVLHRSLVFTPMVSWSLSTSGSQSSRYTQKGSSYLRVFGFVKNQSSSLGKSPSGSAVLQSRSPVRGSSVSRVLNVVGSQLQN